jgi:hypothetical protein
MRIGLAFRSFFAILGSGALPEDILQELKLKRADELPPKEEKKEITPSKEELRKREAESQARAAQMITIFQRDARLIDFLREDIRPYPDAQVGAAVRSLHESCQQVLNRYLQLEPIINSQEGESVTIQDGFDPSSVKLIGNVTGKPPLKGILRHHGWRAAKIELPALPDNVDQIVIAPAEVEIP